MASVRSRWGCIDRRVETRASLVLPMKIAFFVSGVLAAGLFISNAADAQVFVAPTKAFQSKVRYFGFDWMHVDILVGERMAVPEPSWTSSVAGARTSSSS